jgi:hypothetical protein
MRRADRNLGMRSLALLGVASLFGGCEGGKSKLDADRAADVDALWKLAPDGTELGLVASPRAVDLTFRAIAAVRELTAQPDLAPLKSSLDNVARGMFGSETATPEDAGFSAQQPFAMFATSDGVIGIMPVGDRDKFMAAKRGKRGSAEDTLEANTCRMLDKHYVCTTDVKLFDRLGKGSLAGKVKGTGVRGDAELVMTGLPLLGENKGELAIAARLGQGTVDLSGTWTGTPDGVLGKLVGVTAPHPDTSGAAGFVSFNAAPLLASLPSIPIAGGVTTDQLAAAMTGPISAVIPSGSIDIQVYIPLKDLKPATTILENCADIATFFKLAEKQTPGACRVVLQGTNALELDIWVDGSTLRFGAHKGPAPVGKPGALTAVARELAAQDWTASLWGRGTMLNLSGIAPAQQEVSDQIALGIHAMGLVNELGTAAKVTAGGVKFRVFLRTVWANPDDVVAKYIAVPGKDIITGKATEVGQALAATAPQTPFAADFGAGQGGLMMPAAAIGLATSVVIPAIAQYIGGGETPAEPTGPAMQQGDLVKLLVEAYVKEAYPKWKTDHPGKSCPDKLEELAKYFGENPGIPVLEDPWGHPLVMRCDDKGLAIISLGEDGKQGTGDDVISQ